MPLMLYCYYKMHLGKFKQDKECKSALEAKNKTKVDSCAKYLVWYTSYICESVHS